MTRLDVGASVSASVLSRPRWNDLGIDVRSGDRYDFSAGGEWVDKMIPCGPDGYRSAQAPGLSRAVLSLAEPFRRVRQANWFALIGAVDREEETCFLIGSACTGWSPPRDGKLVAFANDHPWTYGNNRGQVTLTITRTA